MECWNDGAGLSPSFGYAQDKLCSPSMGTPLLQQIALMDNGIFDKIEETPDRL